MSKPVVINGLGGVNLVADATGLAPNELQIAKNLFSNAPGTFGHRKVMSFMEPLITQPRTLEAAYGTAAPLWASFASGTFGGIKAFAQSTVPGCSGIAVMNVEDDSVFGLAGEGDQLWILGEFGGYGYNISTVLLSPRGNTQYCICNIGQRTIVLDGTSSGYLICRRRDAQDGEAMIDGISTGGIVTGLAETPDDVVIQRLRLVGVQDNELQPLFAVVRGNRVVYGAPDSNHASTTFWSDPIDQISPDSWRTVGDDVIGSRSFVIGTDIEGGITAMWSAAIAPDAAQPQTACYVYKQNALYMSVGEPGYSSDLTPSTILGSLNITRLNTNAGCIAPDSIVWTPQGMIWAGVDDVWMMGVGQIPHRVGTKIKPMLAAQPASVRHRLHAVYHDGAYKLAMFSDGQGPTAASACAEQWWLDLHDQEVPQSNTAQWWGPQLHVPAFAQDAGTYAMCIDARAGYEPALIAPQIAVVPGGYATSVQEAEIPVLVSFESFGSFDAVLPTLDYVEWEAAHDYVAGEVVRPGARGGREFLVVTGGTSAGSEPAWNSFDSDLPIITITDGTVVWAPRSFCADANGKVPWTWLTPCLQTGLVLYELRSREFSEPDARLEKLLDGLDVVFKSSQPQALTVTLLPDQESADQVAVMQGMQSSGPEPLPLSYTAKWSKRFLPPLANRRSRASTFQVHLTQLAKFMVPWELRYLTFWDGGSSTWQAVPIVGTGDTLSGNGIIPYTGTADFDPDEDAIALDSALVAAALPASVLAGLGYASSFTPDDGVPQSTPGALVCGDGNPDTNIAIPWDETTFSGYDPLTIDSAIRAELLASNQFWLQLMGFDSSVLTDESGALSTAPRALPNTASAIVQFKEFSPRVRIFRRSPT